MMRTNYILSASLLFILLTNVEGQEGFYPYYMPTDSINVDRIVENSGSSQITTERVVQPPITQPTVTNPSGQFVKAARDDQVPVGARSSKACREYYLMLKDLTARSASETDGVLFETRRLVQPTRLPHMALIGFGKKEKIYWRCGGSLISPRFILAPGHCVASRRHGAAKWVMLGAVDPYDLSLPAHAQLFAIADRLPVTGFRPPSLHDDLSVIKLERDAQFSDLVRPACLSPRRPPLGSKGTVAGWELVNWIIQPGRSRLMETEMQVLPDAACAEAYKSHSRLDGHYEEKHLLCIGNHQGMTAGCERDTGGPFHIQTKEKLFVISAVVILGNTVCERRNNTPVLTTDVVSYLSEIEDLVWPVEVAAERAINPQ